MSTVILRNNGNRPAIGSIKFGSIKGYKGKCAEVDQNIAEHMVRHKTTKLEIVTSPDDNRIKRTTKAE